jgi:hypothetical protein
VPLQRIKAYACPLYPLSPWRERVRVRGSNLKTIIDKGEKYAKRKAK